MKRVERVKNKRDVGILLLTLMIIISLVLLVNIISSARADYASDEQEKIPQAYKWLINHTKNKWNTLNLKQDAFSLLALNCNSTYVAQGNRSLYNLSYYNSSQKIRCWKQQGKPARKEECRLTETSLAKLALSEIDGNTTYVDNWLLNQNRTFVQGIYWFLEIDVARGKKATCEIMYGDTMQNVTIFEDKKVYVQPSSVDNCILNNPFRSYWFQIKQSDYCYSQEYLIKCFGNESVSEPVLATLLYRNNTNDPKTNFFVSSEISTGTLGFIDEEGGENPSAGAMQINVPSYCLANPSDPAGTCDYEGTAWATYLWNREGNADYANMFIPYLVVYSSFNNAYFPESFLSNLVGSDYTAQLNEEQQRLRKPQSRDYWSFWLNQNPMWYGQFYDTPKAVLSLGESTSNISEVKDYLLGHLSRESSWINTFDAAPSQNKDTHRDTAFILWVFWPNYCPGAGSEGGENNNSCVGQGLNFFCQESCDADQFQWYTLTCPENLVCCENRSINPTECADLGGECMNGTLCPSEYGLLESVLTCPDNGICCKRFSSSSCYDWNGEICEYGYSCPENQSIHTLEGECCLTSCVSGNTSSEHCFDLGGTTCENNQICWSYTLQEELPFISALESNCCSGDCIKDQTCSELGGKDCTDLGSEYQCVDSSGSPGETTKTKDITECCVDDCKKTCASDKLCKTNQKCSQYDTSAVEPNCCLNKCESKKSPLLLIVIIIVIVLAIFIYFFVFRKKKNKEENADEFSEFSQPSGKSTKKSEESLFMPRNKQVSEPDFGNEFPSEEPKLSKPEKKRTENFKFSGAHGIPNSRAKAKTKAEEELEETLGKLKKMTKK